MKSVFVPVRVVLILVLVTGSFVTNANAADFNVAFHSDTLSLNTVVTLDQPTTFNPFFVGNGNECTTGWHYFSTVNSYITLDTQSGGIQNYGIWQPNLPTSGTWLVEVYNPVHPYYTWPCSPYTYINNDTGSARYEINYDGGSQTVTFDQQNRAGWQSLGTFNFTAGSTGYIKLGDVTGEPNYTRGVQFSGMRFTLQAAATSSISGQVVNADNNNNPLSGVTVSLNNGASATTDVNGNYTLSGIPAGSYTLTPSKNGMSFGPSNRSVTVPPDATGQNFTASPLGYFISGRVTDGSGDSIPGVPIRLDGTFGWNSSTTTDGNGYYLFSGLTTGYYGVGAAPESSYILSPGYRTYCLLTYNAGYQDFSTTPHYGSINGKVTSQVAGAAIANAKVAAGGKQTTTDANGNYSISNLVPGNFKISVSAANYADFSGELTISSDQATSKNVTLSRLPSAEYYLPYPGGVSHQVTCGHGCNEHIDNIYYSYDFSWNDPTTNQRNLDLVAVADGVVKEIKYDYIRILNNQDHSYTLYAHMDSLANGIVAGAMVYRGTPVGVMGCKGNCSGTHLHFTRYDSQQSNGWKNIETEFAEGGVLETSKIYKSQNFVTPALTSISSTTAISDAEPPYGSVHLEFAGHSSQYHLVTHAVDYASDVAEMRVAATEGNLTNTLWQPYSPQIAWGSPIVFVQFKDTIGNVSLVYSDWLDAVGYDPVTASFAISPTACVNQALQIANNTMPYCEQCGWKWELGDGQISNQIEPQFDPYGIAGYTGYQQPGLYTVTLTVSNYDSIKSAQQTVEALPLPSAEFTRKSIDKTVYVEATDSTAKEFLWDFGDGYTATGKLASHTYADPNAVKYSLVTLTAMGQNACSSSFSQYAQGPTVYLPLILR